MWNMYDAFIMQTGVRLNKLQKVLLMVSIMLMIIGIAKYGFALVGYKLFWYTVEKWMVISEMVQQILLYPIVCMAIWRIPE